MGCNQLRLPAPYLLLRERYYAPYLLPGSLTVQKGAKKKERNQESFTLPTEINSLTSLRLRHYY